MAGFFFGFFFTFIEECCIDRQKSLQIELVTKYDTKNAYKESLVGGPNLRRGGPYPLADLDGGGVQIRCDTGSFHTDTLIKESVQYTSLSRC